MLLFACLFVCSYKYFGVQNVNLYLVSFILIRLLLRPFRSIAISYKLKIDKNQQINKLHSHTLLIFTTKAVLNKKNILKGSGFGIRRN